MIGWRRCRSQTCWRRAGLDQALRGERSLADAMAEHQRARDERVGPLFELTAQLATLEGPPPEVQRLLGAIQGHPAAMDAFVSVIAGTLSPATFFAPDHVASLLAADSLSDTVNPAPVPVAPGPPPTGWHLSHGGRLRWLAG